MVQTQQTGHAVFHLFEEVEARLPFWQYFEIFQKNPYAYFLDSALADKKVGNYSFMGSDPFLIYKAYAVPSADVQAVRVTLHRPGRDTCNNVEYQTTDLFADLKRIFEQYKTPAPPPAEPVIPFYSGGIGYFAYEAGALIEKIPVVAGDDTALPLACFLFVDYTLCYCHHSEKMYISVMGRGENLADAAQQASVRKARLVKKMARLEKATSLKVFSRQNVNEDAEGITLESQYDRQSYCAAIEKIQGQIREGCAYEVCLTHEYSCRQTKDPWALYQILRRINPAPFSSYLQLPELQVVCSSPERFLQLDRNGVMESRPIKGTRRRGETPLHDLKLEDDLRTSEKDRAENLMIVDLVRNDLSRVAETGSVHVPAFFKVERYATVLQLVSVIRGVLKKEYDAFDLIKACFPGGSMTGAPKIEAMKIIASLEKTKRGIYSGAIGYIDFSGMMDMNIVIRSIVVRNGRCYFNVGGAIVSDSNPEAEYEETLDKAKALVAALRA